jgi:hypothetical protein
LRSLHQLRTGGLQHKHKIFFLDGFKKLEQRNHKCVELGGDMERKCIFSVP